MSTVKETARMAGLISGLDTESLIKAATANTTSAINSRKQKVQKLQWKQEAYRDIIGKIQEFQSKYLDITSKDSIRANAVMKSNKATSSNDKLFVSANSSATPGDYKITSIKKATAATLGGENVASRGVDLNFLNNTSGEQTVKVTLDGVTKEVTFNKDANDPDASAQNFLTALNKSFDGILKKDDAGHATQFKLEQSGVNWKLSLDNMASDKVSHIFTVGYSDAVGLDNDTSNTISTQSTLGSIAFTQPLGGGPYKFSINGVDFEFNGATKISDMMSEINKSDAGVKISFSGLTQSFTLESTTTGAGSTLDISQKQGNLLNSLFNIDSKALGSAPTYAQFGTKTVDKNAKFEFMASASGLSDGDNIIINGTKLGITGLTRTQESADITYEGKDYKGLVYKDESGKEFVKFAASDGTKVYADKDGNKLFSVEGGKVYDDNGNPVEGVTESEYLEDTMKLTKKYNAVSEKDYEDALNSAYSAAFGSSYAGKFSVSINGDNARITFDPQGESATADISGNVSLVETGYTTVDGTVSNFSTEGFGKDHVVAKDTVAFAVGGDYNNVVVVNGSGENGAVTIQDMLNATDKDGNALFAYDENSGVLSVTGKNVLEAIAMDGEGNEYNMEACVQISDAFGSLKLVGSEISGSMIKSGENAVITVNGVTLESASNTFSIDGTTFGIDDVQEFDENDIAAGKADEILVTVAKDNSKIKETIMNFMEGYNKLLDDIYEQLNTARPKDSDDYYEPLTDEQKEEMSDKEIEQWEEKAKTGMLYRDTTLTKVFNQLRSAVNGNVGGFTLQALGIDTSNDITEYGKLRFMDNGEAILDSAIERYGDELAAYFTDPEKGLAAKLNNAVNAAVDTKTDARGNAKGSLTSMAGVKGTRSEKKNQLYSQIEALQKVIESLNTRYEKQYERLWKQYSKLETYMMDMSNQSSSLFNSTLYGANNNEG